MEYLFMIGKKTKGVIYYLFGEGSIIYTPCILIRGSERMPLSQCGGNHGPEVKRRAQNIEGWGGGHFLVFIYIFISIILFYSTALQIIMKK